MIKWTKKDCMKAIIDLKSPIANKQGQTNELTPSIEGMRAARPRIPFKTPTKPPIGKK